MTSNLSVAWPSLSRTASRKLYAMAFSRGRVMRASAVSATLWRDGAGRRGAPRPPNGRSPRAGRNVAPCRADGGGGCPPPAPSFPRDPLPADAGGLIHYRFPLRCCRCRPHAAGLAAMKPDAVRSRVHRTVDRFCRRRMRKRAPLGNLPSGGGAPPGLRSHPPRLVGLRAPVQRRQFLRAFAVSSRTLCGHGLFQRGRRK